MEYRMLGATGLRVSTLGYGASPLGGVFGAIDEAEGIRTVRTALDLGVNLLDVSPYYGATVAETVLGRALRGVERSSYVLATKVGRYGYADFDFSARRVIRSVDESLARLGCEYVDLIQCHDIEFGDLDQIVEETIPALAGLRETGKVRFLGITGYPLGALAYVTDRVPVDTVLSYCRYTLLDRALTEWTPRFESRGVGVVNASPLAMGLLTDRGAPPWHPAPERLREHAARAARWCRQRGVDIARVALGFAMAAPRFSTTIVGTASVANLTRNVRWATEPVDGELLAGIEAIVEPVRDTAWPSGRPENNDPRTIDA
jgi:L-galactose dehydrogenase